MVSRYGIIELHDLNEDLHVHNVIDPLFYVSWKFLTILLFFIKWRNYKFR